MCSGDDGARVVVLRAVRIIASHALPSRWLCLCVCAYMLQVPATIDDPAILDEVKVHLQVSE